MRLIFIPKKLINCPEALYYYLEGYFKESVNLSTSEDPRKIVKDLEAAGVYLYPIRPYREVYKAIFWAKKDNYYATYNQDFEKALHKKDFVDPLYFDTVLADQYGVTKWLKNLELNDLTRTKQEILESLIKKIDGETT